MKTTYIGFLILIITLISCDDTDDTIETGTKEPTIELITGTADFSSYVAVGASFTAGYTDGALFKAAQENSFPNILSQEFSKLGGNTLTQPMMNDNIGGLLFGGQENPGFLTRLFFNGTGPSRIDDTPTTEVFTPQSGTYSNMGVPGAKSTHIIYDGLGNSANLATGTANPYYVRMASAGNATVLGDAMAQNPTFFTLSEIGANDVLGYATTGGDGSNPITPSEGPLGQGFDSTFGYIVQILTSGGAKGAVTAVPSITSLPHFTTVPFNALEPENEDFGPQIPTLNATFSRLNAACTFLGMEDRSIVFSETEDSAVVVHDQDLTNIAPQLKQVLMGGGLDEGTATIYANQFAQSRQANENDLFVLPSSSVIGTVNVEYYTDLINSMVPPDTAGQLAINGITYPLRDKWVLIPSEQDALTKATEAYNITIKAVAATNNLAVVDLNAILQEASTTGIEFDDYNMTTDLVFGGLVSLDGIHLTARGYAFMANKFLEAIDDKYESNFIASKNKAKASDYGTNYSPALR